MAGRERTHDVNEAARRSAEPRADSYGIVYGRTAEASQRQQLS